MPTVRLISREEAQQTRTPKTPGVRRQRMNEFDAYARALVENPGEAVIYEGIEEAPQKFVLSLRGAFQRAGVPAVVRKMRGRDEVRAWVGSDGQVRQRSSRAPAETAPEPESNGHAPAQRGRRKAATG